MNHLQTQYIGQFNYYKAMHPKDRSTYSQWVKWRNRCALQQMIMLENR